MNKKILISVSVIILIVIGVVAYILLSDSKKPETPNDIPDISVNNPSGSGSPSQSDSPGDNTETPSGSGSGSDDSGELYYSPDSGVVSLHERTRSEITATMVQDSSSLRTSSGKPNFNIISVKRIDKAWYVVKIVNSVDPSVGTAWVILKDNGDNGGLSIYAGPGTSFTNVDLPSSVRKAIK